MGGEALSGGGEVLSGGGEGGVDSSAEGFGELAPARALAPGVFA